MRTPRFGSQVLLLFALLVPGAAAVAFSATATTTALSITASGSAAATVSSGSVVTLTATVNSGATPVTLGQINFCDAAATSCTDFHIQATAQLTSTGTAAVKFVPGPGNHSYQAVFAGTHDYTGSSSAVSTLAVTTSQVYPSTTTIAFSGTSGNYALAANVLGAGSRASPVPTGLISFLDTSNANTVLTTAALVAGTAGVTSTNAPVSPLNSQAGNPKEGDFNGDGKADLVLEDASGSGPLSIALGNGDGTFTSANPVNVSPSGASPVAVGDFNGDGKTDVVAETTDGVAGTGTFTVLLGNGDGTFTAATPFVFQTIPGQIAVGDFNQDGKPDLAVLAQTNIAILLGNGDGTFTSVAALSAVAGVAGNLAITEGDFNGDGKADLVVLGGLPSGNPSYVPSGPLMTFLGNGDGTFMAPLSFTCCNTSFLASADFNGDGKRDLLIAEPDGRDDAAVFIYPGNGDGTFAQPGEVYLGYFNSSNGTVAVALGDFNGDGIADFAIEPEVDVPVEVFVGKGDGTFPTSFSAPIASSFAVADFDGSGTADLAVAVSSGLDSYLTQPNQTANVYLTGISAGPGTHQVIASYPGDGTYSASMSAPVVLTGSTNAPITFSVPNHNYGDAPFTLAATSISTGAFTYSVISGPATITGATVTLTAPGTVTLQASQAAAGGYVAGTQTTAFPVEPALLVIAVNNAARVFGAPNPAFTGSVTGAVNGDTFSETFSTPANASSIIGTYPIYGSVTGPNLANYIAPKGSATLTVSQAGTATTFALSNQNKTLTATVASLTSGMPTGTVAFYEGQTEVGSGTLTNGIASYTTSTFPAGDVVVSAQYSGDANFTQSGSPPILVLSVAPSNTSLSVAASGSVTDNVTLSPAPGYVGTVQLTCGGLPANATCSFQPASIAFSGTNTTATAVVTIQTGVANQARLQSPSPARDGGPNGVALAAIWVPGLFVGIAFGRGRKTARPRISQMFMPLLLLCGLCAGLSACGSGSTSTTKPASANTPAGTYAVQVIASGGGGLSQTAAVSLTVQ